MDPLVNFGGNVKNQKIKDAIVSGAFIESTLESELDLENHYMVIDVLKGLIFYNRNATFVNFVQKYKDTISKKLTAKDCNELFQTLVSTYHPCIQIADYLPISAVGYTFILNAARQQKNNELLAHIYSRRPDIIHACCDVGNWPAIQTIGVMVPLKRLVDAAVYLINTPVFPDKLQKIHELIGSYPHLALIDANTYENCKNPVVRSLFPK